MSIDGIRWKAVNARFISSCLIGLVLFFNLQCAFLFILFPQQYRTQFDLNIPVGTSVVQAIGILFLMWNVPYVIAFIHPIKYRVSLVESIIMQGIGVFGETLILTTNIFLPANTQDSLLRFIIFDTVGLFLLLTAFFLTRKS